jgi:phosphoribosyl-ATP pyrophosphohydrolase
MKSILRVCLLWRRNRRLKSKGIEKITQKVSEVAVETVIEALRNKDELFQTNLQICFSII